MRKVLPDFFCNERHERVEKPHGIIQYICKNRTGRFLCRFVFPIKRKLRHFNIPVAEIVPDEVIKHTADFTEFIAV
ncbi:Uncharacterised protein [Mycobacteroides abscessus subsp. abscessus]|nr:Uncharacterised protein [Mycobacteroides abscessus subsp. abscessus]